MSYGDYCHTEAGDDLDLLKNGAIIMDDNFHFNVKNEGDVPISPNRVRQELELKTSTGRPKSKLVEETLTANNKIEKEKKLGHRRVHTDGEVSYKNINTSKIIKSFQLGIQRSVGGLTAYPERDVLMADFMVVESTSFTADDTELESTHKSEFVFKTYAPVAFRHFRDLFGIKPNHFLSSFCDAPLVELPNPGASGSLFYLTQNDEFVTKTVQHREAEFLQKLLPGYYLNLNQNPCTLLPKFFGLYCYKCGSKNVRLFVTNNILPSSLKIHHKFDLKGSTYNRKASKSEKQKSSPTFKDLDFMSLYPDGIFLENEIYNNLVKTVLRDCTVLESFKIIDYSLLLGVHNVDEAEREKLQTDIPELTNENKEKNYPSGDGNASYHCNEDSDLRKCDGLKTTEYSENAQFFHKTKSVKDRFDVNRALAGLPARKANGEKLLLFIGIIDILQSYRVKKKFEHVLKSILHDGDSISVHNPRFYARRFQEFLSNTVFKSMPTSQKTQTRKIHPS